MLLTMEMTMHKFFMLLLLGLMPIAVAAESTVLEVMTLKYRTAEQVMPVIQPLLDSDSTLTGMQNHLIISTTPAHLAEIKKLIGQIDRMPRRLLITVKQDSQLDQTRQAAAVSANIPLGGNARLVLPGEGTAATPGVHASLSDKRFAGGQDAMQYIQVLEGNKASIQIGVSVPVSQRLVHVMPNNTVITDTAGYQDIMTGFEVTPQLSGDFFSLEVSPQSSALQQADTIAVQRLTTTVSGRLGEWLDIGGAIHNQQNRHSDINRYDRQQSLEQRSVWIKVEELH